MKNQHILFVCTSCGGNTASDRQGKPRDGAKLLEQLQTLHQDWSLREDFEIQSVKCMGVCDKPCAIALVGSGKFTYLFGSMMSIAEPASDILICASQYYRHSQGNLAYRKRPDRLQDTVIAKIPNLLSVES
jgi:predicted metal-binding protein